MTTLFQGDAPRPLADRLRPTSLGEVVGQEHLLGDEGALRRLVDSGRMQSIVLWGPPGTGKTSIARLLAENTFLSFTPLSAVFAGVADVRKAIEEAKRKREMGQGTLLFVDEIHRFNRAQQDGFLPYVEDGTVTLVGATTENPSFELNAALLSRAQVMVLRRLDDDALETLLKKASALEGREIPLDEEARTVLRAMADGDGRYLLNMVDSLLATVTGTEKIDTDGLINAVQQRVPLYDKAQEAHYNLISALHKSLRGSDADASLYWFARMIAGGEEPRYIARRLVRFASEDIGMADPNAMTQAISGWEAYERLGSPEGELSLAQVIIYLATAPKSNATYRAEKRARGAAKKHGSLAPPAHILNAPTSLMKDLGYGKGYAYDHDTSDGFSGQRYFPNEMNRETYYTPSDRGFEREIGKRLEYWSKLRSDREGD